MLLVLYVPKQKMSKMLATHLLSHIQKRCFFICFWITMYHKYHVRLTCYWVERKVKERSSVDYSCSGNLWNSSNSKGWLNGQVICVPMCVCVYIHLASTFVWQRMRITPIGVCVCVCENVYVWAGGSWSPPTYRLHTHQQCHSAICVTPLSMT